MKWSGMSISFVCLFALFWFFACFIYLFFFTLIIFIFWKFISVSLMGV